jgi:hypothetical protein
VRGVRKDLTLAFACPTPSMSLMMGSKLLTGYVSHGSITCNTPRCKIHANTNTSAVLRFDAFKSTAKQGPDQLRFDRTEREPFADSPDTPTTALLPPTPFLSTASFAHPPTRETPLWRFSRLNQLNFSSTHARIGVVVGLSEWRRPARGAKTVERSGWVDGPEAGDCCSAYSSGQMSEEIQRRKRVGREV